MCTLVNASVIGFAICTHMCVWLTLAFLQQAVCFTKLLACSCRKQDIVNVCMIICYMCECLCYGVSHLLMVVFTAHICFPLCLPPALCSTSARALRLGSVAQQQLTQLCLPWAIQS